MKLMNGEGVNVQWCGNSWWGNALLHPADCTTITIDGAGNRFSDRMKILDALPPNIATEPQIRVVYAYLEQTSKGPVIQVTKKNEV